MFCATDRNNQNWGVLTLPDGSKKIAVIDHTWMFFEEAELEETADFEDKQSEYNLDPEVMWEKKAQELNVFFSTSSIEYLEMFKTYFDYYTPERVTNMIIKIEKETRERVRDLDGIIEFYKKNRDFIANIMNEYNFKR